MTRTQRYETLATLATLADARTERSATSATSDCNKRLLRLQQATVATAASATSDCNKRQQQATVATVVYLGSYRESQVHDVGTDPMPPTDAHVCARMLAYANVVVYVYRSGRASTTTCVHELEHVYMN